MNAPWELPIESQRLGFPGIHSPVILGPNIRGALNQNYVGDGNDCIVKIGSTGGVAHYA